MLIICVLLWLFHVIYVVVLLLVFMVTILCPWNVWLCVVRCMPCVMVGGDVCVCVVYVVLDIVVSYICCCCVCVGDGELLEPRVARVVGGRRLADWSKGEKGIVLLELVVVGGVLLFCVVVVMLSSMAKFREAWRRVCREHGGLP